MSWLFRSLSARLRRGSLSVVRTPMPSEANSGNLDQKRFAMCKILLLDGTHLNIVISRNALGSELYDEVFYSLDLEERDYFGLQFTDHYNVQHWLDSTKKVVKQVAIGPPFTLRFRVKFFTCEPSSNLKEELTRYQFFLQLKHDIANGRLPCSRAIAVELAAYALQSELGDYNPVEHTALFISEFRFHPEQDERMEMDILERFKPLKGQTPAQAELNYLNRARYLDMYGVDMHNVEGKDGNTYHLGLTPQGMLVFDGDQKIGLFLWDKLQKLNFRSKKITLVVEEDADQSTNGQVQLHTFVFNLTSEKACKHFWKCAIEQHTFFRLKARPIANPARAQLFRLGSTFKYRGRTEYETIHKEGARLSRRTSTTFERRPSQRYGARQSHVNNREVRRNEIRQQVENSLLQSRSTEATSSVPPLAFDDGRGQQAHLQTATTFSKDVTPEKVPSTARQPSSYNHVTKISVGSTNIDSVNNLKSAPIQQTSSTRIPRPSFAAPAAPIGFHQNLAAPKFAEGSRIPRMETRRERIVTDL